MADVDFANHFACLVLAEFAERLFRDGFYQRLMAEPPPTPSRRSESRLTKWVAF